MGFEVWVEKDAGKSAHFTNEMYEQTGATVKSASDLLSADVFVQINVPTTEKINELPAGKIWISSLYYRTNAEVIDALNNNGIALTQRLSPCDNGVIIETVFIHESGEVMTSGQLHVPAAKQDPQGYGSALTYARRYSLMAACGIAPEDDDGNAASGKPTPPAAPVPDITDHLSAIEASANSEELATVYAAAINACQGNQQLQTKVMAAKKARIERAKKEKANG